VVRLIAIQLAHTQAFQPDEARESESAVSLKSVAEVELSRAPRRRLDSCHHLVSTRFSASNLRVTYRRDLKAPLHLVMKLTTSGATLIALSLVSSSATSLVQATSLLTRSLSPFPNATFSSNTAATRNRQLAPVSLFDPSASLLPRPPACPPCDPQFNCVLPAFSCLNNGERCSARDCVP
jgi:hypothetical protein